MYFIIRGDCTINIIEHDRKEYTAIKLLSQGSYFGEVGCIYNCPRTASVISRNYNIFGRITIERLKDIFNEYPEVEQSMKMHLYKYNYKSKKFLIDAMSKIEYFKSLTLDKVHEIIYNFQEEEYEHDEFVYGTGDPVDEMFVVQSGCVELYTEFEGNEFKLVRLEKGSLLHHNILLNQAQC
jgi:CRP-like cAMP-binding protein